MRHRDEHHGHDRPDAIRAEGVAENVGAEKSGDDGAEWPYASLLLFGFFGSGTLAGKRLVRRTTAGLLLVVLSVLALDDGGWSPLPVWLWAVGLPLGVGVIGWSYARYLAALDELSRTIQLKALAFSYGSVMVLASAILGWALARPGVAGSVVPGAVLGWLVLAEPLRGLALVVLARRYR